MPDWRKLLRLPAPHLTAEEQAFLDGPTEQLCRMLDDWQITHELRRHAAERLAVHQGAEVLRDDHPEGATAASASRRSRAPWCSRRSSSRNATAASTIGVPNSLGPAELLLHYGTDEQKQRWLPGLANGTEIPCFALTSPRVGSDATALVDNGVVCKGTFDGREVLGIRLNWDKRYITLAPIATVLGLAFKLYDPDHLLGDVEDYGITAALIPDEPARHRDRPPPLPAEHSVPERPDARPRRVRAGRRDHRRPEDGRPGLAHARAAARRRPQHRAAEQRARRAAVAAVYASGAYARLRRQFGLPIGKFHGVGEALARMAGNVYTMTAASRVTVHRDRARREARGAVGDPEVPQHRARPADRERRHGRARRQSDHAGAEELPGARLRVRADRDHGRGREHPDAQPDHLRPGRDPLPSVRARRDGRRAQPRSQRGARGVRSAAVRPHRLRASRTRPARSCWRSRWRDSRRFQSRGRHGASTRRSTATARRSRC